MNILLINGYNQHSFNILLRNKYDININDPIDSGKDKRTPIKYR